MDEDIRVDDVKYFRTQEELKKYLEDRALCVFGNTNYLFYENTVYIVENFTRWQRIKAWWSGLFANLRWKRQWKKWRKYYRTYRDYEPAD